MWNYEIVAEADILAAVTRKEIEDGLTLADVQESFTSTRVFTDQTKFRNYLEMINKREDLELVKIETKCSKCGTQANVAVKVEHNGDPILFCKTHQVEDLNRRQGIAKGVRDNSAKAAMNTISKNVQINGRI